MPVGRSYFHFLGFSKMNTLPTMSSILKNQRTGGKVLFVFYHRENMFLPITLKNNRLTDNLGIFFNFILGPQDGQHSF